VRALVVGVVLFLSFLTGTVALEAYVAHQVVLDPDRAGQALGAALDEPDMLDKVLHRAVPGYRRLPVGVRATAAGVARTDAARRAVRQVRLDDDGTVALAPLQRELAGALRSAGQPRLSAQVAEASGGRVTVPARYMTRYRDARSTSWQVVTVGTLATAVLFLAALLMSAHRRRTVAAIGVTALLSCVAAALLYWALPGIVGLAGSGSVADVAAVVLRAERATVVRTLLPFALVAVVLVVVAAVARPRSRRRA
jgi:hypothetical protein